MMGAVPPPGAKRSAPKATKAVDAGEAMSAAKRPKVAEASTPQAPAEPPMTPRAPNAQKPASAASAGSAVPAGAKPATPAAPATPPAGDHAALAAAFQGTSFALLEDGVGVTTVAGDDLFAAANWAKANGYRLLSNLSAYDRTDHFGVLYCFLKLAATPAEFAELRLRVTMPKQADGKPVEPTCPSLDDLYPAAGWHEREMFDMYGIRFEGSHDLRRMFLPDDWTGHPMRKDYKEPEQFVALREGEDVTVKTQEEGSW